MTLGQVSALQQDIFHPKTIAFLRILTIYFSHQNSPPPSPSSIFHILCISIVYSILLFLNGLKLFKHFD